MRRYGRTPATQRKEFQTFIAVFDGPRDLSERTFEAALWDRLQSLHNIDMANGTRWSGAADPDPASPHFSMSIAGTPYFIVGMHPNASRPARRFDYPLMVFNSHDQFEALRSDGRYQRMKSVIRDRDSDLAGNINPMLDEFGTTSEARQYSGAVRAR